MNDIPFDKISVDTFPLTERSGYAPAWEPIKTEVNLIPHESISKSVKNVISNSFGFGGTNASLIFGI